MTREYIKELTHLSKQLPQKIPYLKMLIVFGSQARGDTHSQSDWDFATLYDQKIRKKYCENNPFNYFEVAGILGDIFNLNSDYIDVVDLNNCSNLIANAVARDGKLIFQIEDNLFDEFKQKFLLTNQDLKQIENRLSQKISNFLVKCGV